MDSAEPVPKSPNHEAPIKQEKIISNKRLTGTVKWFNVKDGFGFITRHDTGEDVFVHKSSILKPNSKHYVRSIGDGEVVEFGLVASKVTGPGFKPVKGSPFVAQRDGKPRPKSSSSGRVKREVRNQTNDPVGDGLQRKTSKKPLTKQNSDPQNNAFSLTSIPKVTLFEVPDETILKEELTADNCEEVPSAESVYTESTSGLAVEPTD